MFILDKFHLDPDLDFDFIDLTNLSPFWSTTGRIWYSNFELGSVLIYFVQEQKMIFWGNQKIKQDPFIQKSQANSRLKVNFLIYPKYFKQKYLAKSVKSQLLSIQNYLLNVHKYSYLGFNFCAHLENDQNRLNSEKFLNFHF